MSEVEWGRPHTTSDMETAPLLEVAYSQSPGQRNPIVSEGEFRLGLQSESELGSDFTARISPNGNLVFVDTQRNCKIIKKPIWNSRSGNPKRLPVSSRSAPGQTPGQLPVSSRSAPGQLPVSSRSVPVLPVTGLGLGIQARLGMVEWAKH